MKNLIFISILFFISLNVCAQGKKMSKIPTQEKKSESIKNTKVQKKPEVKPDEPYAFLVISTDIDIEVKINFKEKHTILESVGGKEIPVKKDKNVIMVTPLDGGSGGFRKAMEFEKGDYKIVEVDIKEKRVESDRLNFEHEEKAKLLEEERRLAKEQARKNTIEEEKRQKIQNCPHCSGSGRYKKRVECKNCGGDGEKKTSVQCSRCSGKGTIVTSKYCYECSGKGGFTCGTCGGSGNHPKWSLSTGNGQQMKVSCPDCSSGKRKCYKCDGNGYQLKSCDRCHGEKKIYKNKTCWECEGSGGITKNVTCQHNY